MLPARHRLRSSADFRAAIRRGRRAGGTVLVLHLLEPAGAEPVRIGLVVSRAVGPAVVRNLVKRRLRHLLRERLGSHPGSLPSSGLLVVRALPGAGAASYVTLGTELDRLLDRLPARVHAGAAR